MKGKRILLAAVVLLSTVGVLEAQEGRLSGSIDLTFLSTYVWRGFDKYPNNHGAIQPSLNLDFYGTGLGLKLFWSRALSGGFEAVEELDLTLYYYNSLFEDKPYATNYNLGWVYYDLPDERPSRGHLQELFASLSWPEAIPVGIVPSYTIVLLWPSTSNSIASAWGGWAHMHGLGYDWVVPGLAPETPEQTLHWSAELVYNGGVGPQGVPGRWPYVDHDWSNFVLGVSTEFDVVENVVFTPGLYYQASMDKSVNTQDEWWVSLGLSYRF